MFRLKGKKLNKYELLELERNLRSPVNMKLVGSVEGRVKFTSAYILVDLRTNKVGYSLYKAEYKGEWYYIAGCRCFTRSEAFGHWRRVYSDTPRTSLHECRLRRAEAFLDALSSDRPVLD